MAGGEVLGQQWEAQAEVDAVVAELGLTMDQVRRWRREGLLPRDIEQDPLAYHGSVVHYPKGTCAQIRAANALFKEKNRVDYVGLNLWRRGFSVDDKHWRPRLRWMGRFLDRWFPLIARAIVRHNARWKTRTIYDVAARQLRVADHIILSRIKKRVDETQLPTFLRVIGDVGGGEFEGFETPIPGEEQATDKAITVLALDLAGADRDSILGSKLNLTEALPTTLQDLTTALAMGRFEDIADMPAEDVARARDDMRCAVAAGFYLYEANRWVYGEEAFGLRLLSWLARKAPDDLIDAMMIAMFRLRQVPGATQSPEIIKDMAQTAYAAFLGSKQLEWLWRNDPRFSKLLNPKRIKQAFADPIALKRWQEEVKKASLRSIDIQ